MARSSFIFKNACFILTVLGANAFPKTNFVITNRLTLNESGADNVRIMSFYIDYKKASSELCWIGAKYDTDKSSQRYNASNQRYSHPYTLFYNSIFRDKKDANLVIAELGILEGASLLMWRDFFKNASIYGFEYFPDLINSFKQKFDNTRITLAEVNVHSQPSIVNAFQSSGMQYDLIIDDTTHQFEDQLRFIETTHQYVKPGGMIIVEDIYYKIHKEQDYIDRLKPILNIFQDYYFITMDHLNKNSVGHDNDKLLVLVKAGAEPIFKNKKKMTIITPCICPSNLLKVKDSIDFNYVDEWIIVYDGNTLSENPHLFANEDNAKIKEYIHLSEGKHGNPQRNYALDHIKNENTYLYFLNDNNAIHKDLYKLLDIIDDGYMYTFNHEDKLNHIDIATFLIDFKLCKTLRWNLNSYVADRIYMSECQLQNTDKWICVNNTLSFYNKNRSR